MFSPWYVYMVLSHGFAMTLVIVTMVLRLNLGLSHGCGLGFRSLDLLISFNHNYYMVIWSKNGLLRNWRKISLEKRFQGSSFYDPERKRRSGQLLCFNFLMNRTRSTTFKKVRMLTGCVWQFCRFRFANFFRP
jgi:hypothetical protein